MSSPLRSLVKPVYIPSFIFSIGQGALQPVIVLASLKLGFSEAGSSAVVGVFGLVGVIAAPLLGRIISRCGDRPSLITGSFISLGALAISLATLAFPGSGLSQWGFVVALALLAIAGQIWSLGRQAYIADNLPPLWRARGLSTLGGMIRLGVLLGPLLATGLLALWAVEAIFYLNIVTSILSLAMVVQYFAPPASRLRQEALGPQPHVDIPQPPVPLPNWGATAIIGTGIIALSVIRSNKNVIIPLWGTALGLPDHIITLAFGMSALIDSALFYPAGKVTDRRGRLWSLVPALVIMSTAIITMIVWDSTLGFFVGAALLGMGNGFGAGIVMTLGADLSPPTNRASFLGIWTAIANTGTAAGPYLASGAMALFGVTAALWATAAVGILGATWSLTMLKPTYARLGMDLRGNYLDNDEEVAV